MNIMTLFLLMLSLSPFFYKYFFWLYVIQLKEYRTDRFIDYIKTPQGTSSIFHPITYVEIILLLLSIFNIFNSSFENILLYLFIIILVLENIYVFLKIIKKNILKPKITFRLLLTTFILVILLVTLYYFVNNIFLSICIIYVFPILFIGVSIFITLPFVICLKKYKYNEAKKIRKQNSNVINIGITGSYGKTSEKEFLVQFLNTKYKVLSTPKNINTELGISDIIIKKYSNKYDYFVAEMGAYKTGEIKTIGEIIGQKYGFITAIGNQHLALFGSIRETMKAKSEIAIEVLKNGGTLYVNCDNKNIRELKFYKGLDIVKYGTHEDADAIAEIEGIKDSYTKFKFKYKGIKEKFKTNLIGTHNIINITGIIAFCIDIGFKISEIKEKLQNLKLPENTLELIKTKNNIILNDTYNLSEGSIFAGLETMNLFENTKDKILIIDDILELGKKAKEIHYNIAKKIAKKGLATKVIYVGVNYEKDFISGLIDGGMKLCNIACKIDEVKKGDILLFEGRKAKILLNKFLGEEQ